MAQEHSRSRGGGSSHLRQTAVAGTVTEMRVGNLLILAGGALVVVGLLVRFAPGLFSWFGNLPGDIRVEGERSRVFIPFTSMILISVVGSLLLNLIARFFRGDG